MSRIQKMLIPTMLIRELRVALMAGLMCLAGAMVAATGPQATEAELLAVLRSDAPEADKAISCKFLAVNGTSVAVADLAQLLANPRLAAWARIPLEVIPGAEASAALLEAATRLDGRLRVGVLHSLGVRGDPAAVPLLAGVLGADDPEVAAASADALGRIATVEAGGLLAAGILESGSPERLDALAAAAVCGAARLHAAGQKAEAVALYAVVRAASVSQQRRAEAIRGTILAEGSAGIPLLVESLRAPTKRLANMAVFTARDLGRSDQADPSFAAAVDSALVRELELAAGEGDLARAVTLIDVLAERNATGSSESVTTALARAAEAFLKPIRLAAIAALGRTGNPQALESLLAAATDQDSDIARTARGAVVALPGETVDRAIKDRLAGSDPTALPAMIELIGRRRIAAVGELLPLLGHSDGGIRVATIVALGSIVDLDNLGVLIKAATDPPSEAEGEPARRALQEASVRMPDREACAATLAAAAATVPAPARVMLLDVLGMVGGKTALEALAAAGSSGEESLEDAATRILGKWMTADAAPVLLAIADAEPGGRFKARALRGYVRIARQFVLPDAERAEMCRQALAVATEVADRKAVLEILARYPNSATLTVAEEAQQVPGLEAEAAQAAATIRAKLTPAN